MHTQGGPPRSPLVRGLPLPGLLAGLLVAGRWQHPGDEVLRAALPWFKDPIDLLASLDRMTRESRSLDQIAADQRASNAFHVTCGSVAGPTVLPWLDAELAFLIAVNRQPGDDVAIALDYRSDTAGPAVVASDVWTDPSAHLWRPVAPSFETFAAMLSIRTA